MDNLPVCKKCCFCLPLRYGLLLWGYLKLFSGIIVLTILALLAYGLHEYLLDEIEIVIIVFAIISLEIIIHIVFIIGSHKKNVKILKVYYYYSIFIWALTITVAVVCTILILVTMSSTGDKRLRVALLVVDFLSFVLYLAMQTFLLLALRSEIIKLRSNCPYRYVRETEDSEGALKAEEDLPTEDKTTQLIDGKETSG